MLQQMRVAPADGDSLGSRAVKLKLRLEYWKGGGLQIEEVIFLLM